MVKFVNSACIVSAAASFIESIAAAPTDAAMISVGLPPAPVQTLPSMPSLNTQDNNNNNANNNIQSNSIHDTTLRIAVGPTSGGVIDPAVIPRGDFFTGFDIRPDGEGNLNGILALSAFTDVSVAAAVDDFQPGIDVGQAKISSGVITNDQDLSTAMDIAIEAGGTFIGGATSFESSFQYSSSNTVSSHQAVGYTIGTVTLPGRYLHNITALQLTDDAIELLQKPDLTDFFDTYGTHYVKTRVYGCQSIASYSYTCKSQSASLDIASSLQANFDGGLFSVGASVSSKFCQYSRAAMCDYKGQTQSSGVGSKSPRANVMLNATIMDDYWKNLATTCAEGAASDSQLLYVELGHWADIPAINNILQNISNSTTALNQAYFFLYMYPQDIEAIALGMVYQQRVGNAINNFPASLKATNADGRSTNTPVFRSGMFDRINNTGMAQQPSLDYWSSLASNHATLVNSYSINTWSTFANNGKVNQAILNNQTFSTLARAYFHQMVAQYAQAAQTYQFTYNSVTATAISFDTDLTTPISAQLVVPVDNHFCIQIEPVTGENSFCVVKSDFHAGGDPIEFGIRTGLPYEDFGYTDYFMAMLWVNMGGESGPVQTFADPYKNPNANGFIDFTNIFQSKYCPTCALPIRFDISFQYNMPDVSFNMNPYD